jgi:hypothetical protein
MGDRTFWSEDCPRCKREDSVEVYDAPSCMQFSRVCEVCNWTDDLDYYETGKNTIELLTKEEVVKRNLIKE